MFKVEFRTASAAFDDENDGNASAEIQRILTGIAEEVYEGRTKGKVFDINGNNVGSWSFERD